MTTIGTVRTIARYPVKSMRGEELTSTEVSFTGLPQDRGFAFVQTDDHGVFPWLTGREHQGLLGYQPVWETIGDKRRLFVRSADGRQLPVESEELRAELEGAAGMPLRLHSDYRGSQDVAYVSVVFASTIRALAEAGGVAADHRRFRMNFVVENDLPPFSEKQYVGATLALGEVQVLATHEDQRCVMITFDPETGKGTPAVLKAAGELNGVRAGLYAAVARTGTVSLGDAVKVVQPAN